MKPKCETLGSWAKEQESFSSYSKQKAHMSKLDTKHTHALWAVDMVCTSYFLMVWMDGTAGDSCAWLNVHVCVGKATEKSRVDVYLEHRWEALFMVLQAVPSRSMRKSHASFIFIFNLTDWPTYWVGWDGPRNIESKSSWHGLTVAPTLLPKLRTFLATKKSVLLCYCLEK